VIVVRLDNSLVTTPRTKSLPEFNSIHSFFIYNNIMNSLIPIEYLEEVADQLELTVDYLLAEFVIDGQLELELFTFPLRYQR
jgi:hypothetical protein